VTAYLLDENVLKELSPTGNANVRAWFASMAPADIHISAMTMFEKRRGWERRKRTDPVLTAATLAELTVLETAYGARLVPIDAIILAEWARLLGAKEPTDSASAAEIT